MIDLGIVKPGSTIRIPFSSFDKDDGSSITMTNYAAADILIYKNGSTTERASTAGFTATTDFDGKTGKHLAIIDLADNTTADFYNAGAEYLVAIDAVTVDTVTTGGWIARFVIGYPDAHLNTTIASLSSQTSFTLTAGPAEDDAINGSVVLIHDIASAVQLGYAVVADYTGSTKTVTLTTGVTFTAAAGDNISIFAPGNARWFAALLTAALPLTPTTAGRALDVSAGGEAGIDWANIGSPTTAVNLSATNIDVDQVVASVSGAVASVTATVNANMTQISGDSTAADNLETAFDDTAGAVPWMLISHQGTLQSVTDTDTVVLAASASAENDVYIGHTIHFVSGTTGVKQSALISDYVGASKTVELAAAVPIALTGTVTYKIVATAPSSSGAGGGATAAEVWAYGTRELTALDEDNTTIDLNSTAVGSVAGAVGSVTGAVGSVTGNVGGNVTGSVGSVAAGGITASSIAADAITAAKIADGAIDAATFAAGAINAAAIASDAITAAKIADGAIDAATFAAGAITATVVATGAIDADALATDAVNEIADGLLDRNMATGTDSGTDNTTTRTVRQALRALRNKVSIAAGTATVTKEDDSTASWTSAITTTAGNPISSSDPT